MRIFQLIPLGNITTNAILDFETTKSFNLTVTITGENSSIDKSITINVQNLEELESGILRYSANYNSVSQANFNATATRDNNSGDLNNYSLDTIVSSEDSTSSSKSVNDYINSSQHTIPVSTITGNGDDSLEYQSMKSNTLCQLIVIESLHPMRATLLPPLNLKMHLEVSHQVLQIARSSSRPYQ